MNPAHLYWGTNEDNVRDCVERGRTPKGSKNARAVLAESDVLWIKSLIAKGESNTEIAEKAQVSRHCVGDIRVGRKWAWLS